MKNKIEEGVVYSLECRITGFPPRRTVYSCAYPEIAGLPRALVDRCRSYHGRHRHVSEALQKPMYTQNQLRTKTNINGEMWQPMHSHASVKHRGNHGDVIPSSLERKHILEGRRAPAVHVIHPNISAQK